jgi:hypothetical protein
LKDASTIELGKATSALATFLCPVYIRGEAYLMLHDANRAAAEFQKFIDHRGIVVNFPWGALARLQLARAYALQGDTAKAKASYQDFLTLERRGPRSPSAGRGESRLRETTLGLAEILRSSFAADAGFCLLKNANVSFYRRSPSPFTPGALAYP